MDRENILLLKNGTEYQRGEVVLRGKKAKTFYAVKGHPELWIMHHLDVVTHDDDCNIREEIPGKGRINAQINNILFGLISGRYADECGHLPIRTHYIGASITDERECLVHSMSHVLPLEVIIRNRAYGSYLSRHPEVKEGTLFEAPLCEFTLKDDEHHDPLVTEEQIIQANIVTALEIDVMREVALKVNQLVGEFFQEIGIELIDFKLVFGRQGNTAVVGDYTNLRVIGELSPDICRLRDVKSGQCLDKDIFRQELPGLSEAYATVLERMHQADCYKNEERHIRWCDSQRSGSPK